MSTYKALTLASPASPLTLTTCPLPSPIPHGAALISPLYTDIASYVRITLRGILTIATDYPFTPGNCCVGRVDAVGPDATSLAPGALVWVDSTLTARDDPDAQILRGFFPGASPGARKLMQSSGRRGCFAEKVVVPLEGCYLLPQRLFEGLDNGGLGYKIREMSALGYVLVAFGGLDDVGVGPGSTVIVAPATGKFSAGGVLGALALGAKVVAASRNAEKMEMLERFPGAQERLHTVVLTGDVGKDAEALMAATGGTGANVYVDVSPPAASGPMTPPHFVAALRALRRNATVLLEGGLMSDISFNYFDAMLRNLTVRGKFMYERAQVERAIRMLENGNLVVGERVGLTVKGEYGLEEMEQAVAAAGDSAWWGGDVLLTPNRRA